MGLKAGKDKYARKTGTMGASYVAMKSVMKSHYETEMDRLAREAGKSKVSPIRLTAYKDGVDAVSAPDFTSSVDGKEDKWYDNYVTKMFV